MKKLLYLLAFLTVSIAGAQDYTQVIQSYLNNNRAQLGLTAGDVEQVTVYSQSFSKSMNVNNVYAGQTINGIEVFNSVSSFAIKSGLVVNANVSFIDDASSKVNASTPSITAEGAITRAAQNLGINSPSQLELINNNGLNYLFNNGNISLNEIPVKLVYQPMPDQTLRLSWDLSIYLLDASHYYSVRIDALSGELIDTIDWVVNCDFGAGSHGHKVEHSILFKNENEFSIGGAQYRVFPMPFSNPLDGADVIVTSPEDATASPFGWHDTDGAGGAEFTITRGNNVWAMEDQNGNNGTGASPDGGATLNFDFPFGLPQPPANYVDASTVNLFYWNNIVHDVMYQYGFDEESGNFQENNYGNPGNDGDGVYADTQDGSGTNNANFSTPPDGSNPRMQMFIWDGGGAGPVDILTINNGPLAGVYQGVPAGFGGEIPFPPLTEDLVVVEDDDSGVSTDPNDACDPITNGGALSGKIAVIRRGECEFGFKGLAAQNEGAVAVIMVNNVAGPPIVMGAGAVGASVTIPMFMVSDVDGEAIIAEALLNTVNGTISGENIPPDLDSSLDNEIVVHEYGHGVSNRLTGGPNNTSCLNNQEQMGEGWSDYLGLMLTMQTGDQAEDVRGLAAYASSNPNGIREAPYSTDFGVNDYTYADVNGNVSVPHGVGFVWATMLWEMTWDLIDQYGFDADIYNGTGGNNIALQLVMDGMKLQACSPGFIDGRDAILQADALANAGANCEIIWAAFARRGLGFSASQGSSGSTTDGVEAFDLPPTGTCLLGIADANFDSNFNVYPNPSSGQINIASKISLGETTVTIVDMNGRTVYSQKVNLGTLTTLDASKLTTGIYLVNIEGDTYTHTSKLIMK
ncbi:T9SS-dependent M36 family metallopeptidase [Aureisphaera sp. CAU 1614]|uniref:T9SS-dependent M36 family metallopeptidase n=1 Tax=Halomarinibacterium sedimenti TaxID=2857106 RepID=A0A9X1FPS8_9FLAO|nr:T9SS-dependent M36 family metallopeptidase [Halomarinibacterium sedimenti]MBW2938560.1 T9SS-dependent M36 family metallopeptidase [Halomarinibacterium sedimenti]